ncbi:hypothetical protein Tco_0006767 [Tanacetum coccineum]
MLDAYTSAMCTESWGRSSYARAMVELRVDVELKYTLVVVVLKFKNLKNPIQANRGVPVGSKPKSNFIYRPIQSTIKTDKAPTKPKVTKATIATTSTSNSFDALSTLVDDDDCGASYWLLLLTGLHMWHLGILASDSLNTTLLAERINKLERQMLDGKLMLVDDDGKLLNKVDFDQVNSHSESEVEMVYDEIAQLMANRGANDVENLKDQLDEQEKIAQERERVAKELQQVAEERKRAAEQQVKGLEHVKDIVNMLKTLKPQPSPPAS